MKAVRQVFDHIILPLLAVGLAVLVSGQVHGCAVKHEYSTCVAQSYDGNSKACERILE